MRLRLSRNRLVCLLLIMSVCAPIMTALPASEDAAAPALRLMPEEPAEFADLLPTWGAPWEAAPSGVILDHPYVAPRIELAMAGRARWPKRVRDGTVATLLPEDLVEYRRQPKPVQTVIRQALALTQQGLGYKYGSEDPQSGGMDCSGTIYYILRQSGWSKAPRTSQAQYLWLQQYRTLNVVDGGNARRYNNDRLRPGDLLFWIHTYRTRRNPPITHVGMYLGRDRRTGRHVMVHAGGGRRYAGVPRRGVTVVELEEPTRRGFRGGEGSFVGYGSIPGAR